MLEEIRLHRSITLLQGTAISVGAVIGSGILILPSITAEEAGPAAMVSWIVMALLSLPLALTLGRLATAVPSAGGIAAYARAAFGPMAGHLVGWLFLGTIPVGAPIAALVGANYVGSVFHLTAWPITGIAAVMMILSVILNGRGIQIAAWVQVLIVSLIIALLVAAAATAAPHVDTRAFHPFVAHGWSSVAVAAMTVFWCFAGWEMVAHLAEEFRNPGRDILLSLGIGAIVISLLYVAVEYVTIGTKSYGASFAMAPLAALLEEGFGQVAYDATAFLALLITFGTIHTNIAGFSRMVYAQAREGDFPKVFGQLHRTYQTPVVALIGMICVFAMVLLVNGLFRPSLGTFMQWVSAVFLILYMIAMAAALKLLPKGDFGWWMAIIPLVVCAVLYTFSGWAIFYPPALIAVGWIFATSSARRVRQTS